MLPDSYGSRNGASLLDRLLAKAEAMELLSVRKVEAVYRMMQVTDGVQKSGEEMEAIMDNYFAATGEEEHEKETGLAATPSVRDGKIAFDRPASRRDTTASAPVVEARAKRIPLVAYLAHYRGLALCGCRMRARGSSLLTRSSSTQPQKTDALPRIHR